MAPARYVADDLAQGRMVQVQSAGTQADGVWSVLTLGRGQASPTASELVRFV